jgi:hypothetical protein
MTGVAHTYQFTRRGLLTTWTSHRLASQLALIAGAIIMMAAGYLLATQFGSTASPPLHFEVPMSTAPGAGA